jgi:ABC-type branched-subunit amino acid transport system substrate-binding protein
MHSASVVCVRLILSAVAALMLAGPATAADAPQAKTVRIAALLSMTGYERSLSLSAREGMELALDEANRSGDGPAIVADIYDEASNVDDAGKAARAAAASPSVLTLGSIFTFLHVVEGPILARAGMAALATATSDVITRNPTTFRVNYKNTQESGLMATYLYRVLGRQRVAAIVVDDGYGASLRTGFDAAAQRLGLGVSYSTFSTPAEADAAADSIIHDPGAQAVALLMLDNDAARLLTRLRQGGVTAPVIGPIALSGSVFGGAVAGQAEERQHPGALTGGVYATSPVILDSANAETLGFAALYRARYGHDPDWAAIAWHDTAVLAVAAIRHAAAGGAQDTAAMRAAVLAYLQSLDSPAHAVQGALGPIWFDQDRGKVLAPIRVGRFSGGRFESAPLQIVPVAIPATSEIASGAVFQVAPGRFARLQRVVYTGIYLNEVPHIDIAKSSFGADFYVWLRYAQDAGPNAIDPTDISFPNLISGSFDQGRPAESGAMPDGTVYRLWRVRGEFRNDFDLHDFPFDQQTLQLPFFNASGASDRIIYVLDRQTNGQQTNGPGAASPHAASALALVASPTAFTGLTQWRPVGGTERRDNLVTPSSLGDPRLVTSQAYRELSGFVAVFQVRRLALSTVVKTLMPLLLMTMIIYTSLHFPPVLIKEKVTVAVTGALSGAVLLVSINTQLGSVGYTIAIEYAFFVFFGLTTFVIVAALTSQHLRHVKRDHLAVATEQGTRLVFALAVAGLVAGALLISSGAGAAP